MYFWYKFLTYLFYPFSSIYLFFRKLRKKEHPIRYKEKLSQIKETRDSGILIWFHVASVGEGLSILPLIENLVKEDKIHKILITSITLSSSEVLQKRLNENKKVIHQFLPLDIPILANKFLNHWRPNLCIFIDSEIWPNIIYKIKEKKIPLLLVNARITQKTFSRWLLLKNFSEKIFEKFDLCIASNKETENRLKILGAKKIKNYGNLKFAKQKSNFNNKIDSLLLNKIENRKVWCAGSTHPSEEIFCANAHLQLKKIYANILTIIIPRHIDRVRTIKDDLNNLNLKVNLYSKIEQVDNSTDILLVDAYGEVSKFYNISKCVFVGGSLIKHGGQNPIEPSRLGCKIFHGPHINNFKEIYEYLKSLGITNQIHTTEDLNQSLVEEFKTTKTNNNQIIEQIDNYGLNILNCVIKDLKKYISI